MRYLRSVLSGAIAMASFSLGFAIIAAAIPLLHRVVFVQATNLGPYSADLLQTLDWLAHLYRGQRNADAALVMMRRMLEIHSRVYGRQDRRTAPILNGIGLMLHQKGDAGAADLFRKAIDIGIQFL